MTPNHTTDNLHLLFQGEGTQTACTCGKSFGLSGLAAQHQTLMNSVVLERERRRLEADDAVIDLQPSDPEANSRPSKAQS